MFYFLGGEGSSMSFSGKSEDNGGGRECFASS